MRHQSTTYRGFSRSDRQSVRAASGGKVHGGPFPVLAGAHVRVDGTSTDTRNPPQGAAGRASKPELQTRGDSESVRPALYENSQGYDYFSDRSFDDAQGQGNIVEVGNPFNPRLRREWEAREGRPWPRDPLTGRYYDVAHIKALADGGTNTLDNIRPLHPRDHAGEHRANGDHSRWGKRARIARAFGGRVERAPRGLSILSGMLGMVSGRIRMDSFDNFSHDMLGLPSLEDQRKATEAIQRSHNPRWKWGDPLIS
jgi:hypothetical protein